MLSFVLLIAISFCAPNFPSTGNLFPLSACMENILGGTSLNITCRGRSQSCDPPQELAPKKVCNDGLRCIMIKYDHEYRCALIDEIDEDEKDFNLFLGYKVASKAAMVIICIIIVLIAMLWIYLYNLSQQQLHLEKNKTLIKKKLNLLLFKY
jgi:hypothetical protein